MLQKTWCVAKPSSDEATLQANINYACSHVDCLVPRKVCRPCSSPDNLLNHGLHCHESLLPGCGKEPVERWFHEFCSHSYDRSEANARLIQYNSNRITQHRKTLLQPAYLIQCSASLATLLGEVRNKYSKMELDIPGRRLDLDPKMRDLVADSIFVNEKCVFCGVLRGCRTWRRQKSEVKVVAYGMEMKEPNSCGLPSLRRQSSEDLGIDQRG
ncbi:hypothetical protein RJ641_034253 [Dillenia turbinata]|uniref:X8 domain-containing protein n=1 Tax=Dillenia turbinata TaxID=194707 RepID=A0AAN8ZHG4_9MAGN